MRVIGGFLTRWWAVLAIVVAWQAAMWIFRINPFLIPGPISIVKEIGADPLAFVIPLLLTLRTAVIGFLLGVGVGYAMAAASWMWPIFGTALTPVALVIRSVPFVALIPVLTRLIGYGNTTAWIICAMVCFFPTFVLVSTGLRDIPPNGDDLFRSVGASRFDRFRLLAVPASLVGLATSIRIAAASSFAAALIAEFLMGTEGLAFTLSLALGMLDMRTLWGTSFCAIVVSIIAYLLSGKLERKVLARWR